MVTVGWPHATILNILHLIITAISVCFEFTLQICISYGIFILNLTKRKKLFKMKRKSLHSDHKKKRERCRQRCGHCQQLLSDSQYHHHRRLYYNSSLEQWKTVEDIKRSSVPDVLGSSSSESESEGTYQFHYLYNKVRITRWLREQQIMHCVDPYVSLAKPFRLNLKLFVLVGRKFQKVLFTLEMISSQSVVHSSEFVCLFLFGVRHHKM